MLPTWNDLRQLINRVPQKLTLAGNLLRKTHLLPICENIPNFRELVAVFGSDRVDMGTNGIESSIWGLIGTREDGECCCHSGLSSASLLDGTSPFSCHAKVIGRQFYTYIFSLISHSGVGRKSLTSHSEVGLKSLANYLKVNHKASMPLIHSHLALMYDAPF